VNFKKSPRKKQSKFKKTFATRPSSPCAEFTYGEVFDDGTSIDVVFERASGESQLFVHTREAEFVAAEFQAEGVVFRPGRIPLASERFIHFPDRAENFESPEKLFSELRASFEAHGFASETSAIAAFFSIANCFFDVLPQAPVLSVTGPEREAMLFLDLLACTTRRGLRIGDFDLATLRALPMDICPTLLINSTERSRAARQLFRTTNYRGVLTPNCGTLINFCCAKAIYEGLRAVPSREYALRVRLLPFSGRPPAFHTADASKLAHNLQPKLMSYRARYIHEVRASQFDAANFAVGTRAMAQLYGATLAGSKRLEAELIDVLKAHEIHVREEAWTDFRSVVLEVCIHLAHTKPEQRVTVGEVANEARFLLSARGDESRHSDREVGAILSEFGVQKKLRTKGWTLTMDKALSGLLHDLAREHGILSLAPAGQYIHCDDIRLTSTSSGREKP